MDKNFTGRNREAARFLGESEESFEDPGFCLLCGEASCECDESERALREFDEWNPRGEGR